MSTGIIIASVLAVIVLALLILLGLRPQRTEYAVGGLQRIPEGQWQWAVRYWIDSLAFLPIPTEVYMQMRDDWGAWRVVHTQRPLFRLLGMAPHREPVEVGYEEEVED